MQTNLLVNFEADVWTDSGDVLKINVSGLPALWVWEDGPRESVEFRTAMDYMSENVLFYRLFW